MTAGTKAKLIVFLNALTLIGGAITIILLTRVITTAAKQNTDTNSQIVASQKVTENELRCLASFFSQTNRQNISISNLESCEILHTDTGKKEILPLAPTIKTQSSPAVPSSDTKQNSTTISTPTQPITLQPTDPQTSAASQTTSQVNLQPAATPLALISAEVGTHTCIKIGQLPLLC